MQLLGVQMALPQGNGCAEVFNLYQRSLEAAAAAKSGQRNNAEFRALWGLQSYHLVRGEVQAAMTIGRMVLSRFAGSARGGRTTSHYRLLAHRMHGLAVMLNGQLDEAVGHYGVVLESYDPARDAGLRFAFGSDQAALALAHRAWTRELKGDRAGARDDCRLARRRAETLAHGHTSAHVLGVLAIAALQAGLDTEAALAAQEARAIAVEHDFPYWVAWADVILAAGQQGRQPSERMRALEAAISAYERQNARQLLPLAYGRLAQAALEGGLTEPARQAVTRGLAVAADGGTIIHRPQLRLIEARVRHALGEFDGEAKSRELALDEAATFGAGQILTQIALDGCMNARGQAQIQWQQRYHASLRKPRGEAIERASAAR